MSFAELTGAHVYVVHTSCEEAVHAARTAIDRGVHAWIETVIPYLVLDKTYAERPGFEGAKYVMSPPIREKRHQAVLWNALRSRLISTVATDHAPFDFRGQKEMGKNDFTKIPNGIPSVENRIDLLYTYGVTTGRIDLQHVRRLREHAGGADLRARRARARSPSAPTRTCASTTRRTAGRSPPRSST